MEAILTNLGYQRSNSLLRQSSNIILKAVLQSQQLKCSSQLLSLKTRIVAPLRINPSAVRLPLTHMRNLRMTPLRRVKPWWLTRLPFCSFYEVSRYYGNCQFISKSGAISVQAFPTLKVLCFELARRSRSVLRQPLYCFLSKRCDKRLGSIIADTQLRARENCEVCIHSLWITKKSQTTATAIL